MVFKIILAGLIFSGTIGLIEMKQPTIVFLFDGFRWDYIEKFSSYSSTFQKFQQNGVRAEYMIPVHPSNTYPNMYSIATGRDPECHQMVDNVMYDRPHNEWFLMHPDANASHPFWYEGAEPIWVTAVKNNKKVAMYYWYGCETKIRGYRPTYCQVPTKFYTTTPQVMIANYSDSIQDAVQKLRNENYDLIMLYMEYTDFIGHYGGGPEGEYMPSAVGITDAVLGILCEALKGYDLINQTNIILISDHGMTQSTPNSVKFVDLNNTVDFSKVQYMMGIGSSAGILPLPGKIDEVYNALKSRNIEGIDVYKYHEIPEYFHMKRAERIQGWIYIMAKPGFYIRKIVNPAFDSVMPWLPESFYGIHGYDVDKFEDMRAIFLASGPAFKKNKIIPGFKNLDLYNLLCLLVQIMPLSNNGDTTLINESLMDPDTIFKLVADLLLIPVFILRMISKTVTDLLVQLGLQKLVCV